jgi:ABC-type glycerol-3-phosphate transport system substrate-binding protein
MMNFRSRWFGVALAVTALIGALVPLATLRAQSSAAIISVAVPNFMRDTLTDQLLGEFENQHPDVKVNVVRYDSSIPGLTGGLDNHLAAVQTFTSTADVLYIDSQRLSISPAATRAGYFLDLTPIVNEDTTLNVDDFYPAIWQSFQWDKGIWALPLAANTTIMSYDPAAFDAAGLAYPSERWTLDDLINAVNKLAQKDSSGAVTVPGLAVGGGSLPTLFRSLLPAGVFDANTIPNPPQLDTPPVEALLDAWAKLQQDGLVTSGNTSGAPISISNANNLLFQRPNNNGSTQQRVPLLLPGGKAGLTVQGFAVSGGTLYPEKAYALASFLTKRGELAGRGSIIAARKSLTNAQSGPGGGGPRRNISPEVQAVIDQAAANGIPASEMRFADYLNLALQQMTANKIDAKTALQDVEAKAVQDIQAAADRKQSLALAVATPVPVPTLGAGKVTIKFGLSAFISPLPSQDKWNDLMADFTSNDPQVGRVVIDTPTGGGQVANFTDRFDCFYLPYNAVPNTTLGVLMNLDPFIAADKTFDKADVVGNVMVQLERDNKIWALPVIIEPSILRYNSDQFNRANVPAPGSTWTIDAFKDAVTALKPNPEDPVPFVASNTNGVHLLQFIAAYGGLPLDYRTDPPTIDFTSQASADAIRQVLDLARKGYIKYDALSNLGFGGGRAQRDVPIYSDVLNAFSFRFNPAEPTDAAAYKPITYPRGSKYAAVSYSIGTLYVSAKSQNPEGCYRWISAVSRRPDLFSAMPARRSLINNPALAGSQGPDTTALYNQIDTLLQDPNTLSFPQLFGGGASPTGFLLQHWLFEAFDQYVLENGDLDTALKDAETFAKGFQECAANIPPFDPSTQQMQDYNRQYAACASKVDPRLNSLFGN